MCLSFLWWNSHPAILLVLLFNRDEFLDRSAEAPTWWSSGEIFAGRDAAAGGTWLGISRTGRFAALTNFREPVNDARPYLRSRGDLVTGFLASDLSPAQFLEQSAAHDDDYGAYNFVCGDLKEQSVLQRSNRARRRPEEVPAGLHAVSNGDVLKPWPKMAAGLQALPPVLASINAAGEAIPWGALFDVMSNTTQVSELDELEVTGIAPELEQQLSGMFVEDFEYKGRQYGTRSQSAIVVRRDGGVSWHDRWRIDDTSEWSELEHDFSIDLSSDRPTSTTAKDEL